MYIPRHSSTPAVCRKIAQDWGEHPGPVYVYGDATGGAQGSARVQGSDWDLVKAELRPIFGSRLTFKVPQANPKERARVNSVNSLLRNAAGHVRLMVDPQKAPHVVKDFEGVRLLVSCPRSLGTTKMAEFRHWQVFIGDLISRAGH